MYKRYLVEFVGSLFLMFVILTTGNWAAIGGALSIAVLLGGNISRGAYNPAVAITLAIARKISYKEVIPYIIVEILGMVVAYYFYLAVMKID
jgi:glycerol uptake facilitator-like aquaporin